MAKVIFFGNYKGGVGKTTSVFSVAYFMATDHGKKVLMIDLDPQSSLSEICLRNVNQEIQESDKSILLKSLPPNETLNYVFDLSIRGVNTPSLPLLFDGSKLIKQCKYNNMSFVPSSLFYEKRLGMDELAMRMKCCIEHFSILPQLLKGFECHKFDYVLVDCPPTSNVITQSAFMAADYYVVPTIEDGLSINGVLHYVQTVGETYDRYCSEAFDEYLLYRHFFGSKPKMLGIFYTLCRAQINYSTINAYFSDALKDTNMPEENIYLFSSYTDNYVDIARAIAAGAVSMKPNTAGEVGYQEITKELMERMKYLGG